MEWLIYGVAFLFGVIFGILACVVVNAKKCGACWVEQREKAIEKFRGA